MTKTPKVQVRRTSNASTAAGSSLVRGVRQALAYERGKLKGRVEVYEVPRCGECPSGS